MEGQWALAGKGLVSLSEEELVQCSDSTGNMGCNGGLMDQAFEWVAENGGIDSEVGYPYTSGGGYTGDCINSKLADKVANFPTHKDLPNSEQQMATWTCTGGPIAIGVDATSWQTYTGGIMSNCQGTQMDHGVLIVGFDSTNSPPYWTIKNSWGASWGENGYLRVEMGTDQCGLTQAPSTANAGGVGPTPPSPSSHSGSHSSEGLGLASEI
jgi:cysteine peptidase B